MTNRTYRAIVTLALVGAAGVLAAAGFAAGDPPAPLQGTGMVAAMGCPSITDYGADPGRDDNTSQIQQAIDAQGRYGGCLYVPPGTYRHGGTIRVRTGMQISGPMEYESSGHVAAFQYTGAGTAWMVTSQGTADSGQWVYMVRLSGFRIYSSTGHAQHGLLLDKASEGEIARMAIGGARGSGFEQGLVGLCMGGYNIHDTRIEWNTTNMVLDACTPSVTFGATSSTDNLIRKNMISYSKIGIAIRNASSLQIEDNSSEGNDDFLYIDGATVFDQVYVEDVRVIGNASVNGDSATGHGLTRFFRMSDAGGNRAFNVRVTFEGNRIQVAHPSLIDNATTSWLAVAIRFIDNQVTLTTPTPYAWRSTRPELHLVTQDNVIRYWSGGRPLDGREFEGVGAYEPRNMIVAHAQLDGLANARNGTRLYCEDCGSRSDGTCQAGGDGRSVLRHAGKWRCGVP